MRLKDIIMPFIVSLVVFVFTISILAYGIYLDDKNKITTDISCNDAKNLELYIKQYNHHGSDKYTLVKIKD